MIKMIRVESKNIRRIGYNSRKEILKIEFKSGGIYQYYEVPDDMDKKFMRAKSKDSFFRENIKGIYDFDFMGTLH